MHHSHRMTIMNHSHDLTAEISRSSLRVMTLCYDPIKELTTSTKLHDQVDRVAVLISPFELHNIPVTRQMVHDLNLTPYILDVITVDELPRGYGFTSELFLGLFMGYQVRNPKLATTQFASEHVGGPDVLHGPAQYSAHGGGAMDGRGRSCWV